jgi:hypothetical protein
MFSRNDEKRCEAAKKLKDQLRKEMEKKAVSQKVILKSIDKRLTSLSFFPKATSEYEFGRTFHQLSELSKI